MTLAITGPTSGIGIETVKALAQNFEQIFLLARNVDKAGQLLPEFSSPDLRHKFQVIYCDLTDLESVNAAAESILGKAKKLDVLINNAGGLVKEKSITKDGVEHFFSLNHLGHFLLTQKLLPLLEASAEARIINVSSDAHRMAKPDFENLKGEKSFSAWTVYANVKLFNILFTKSLAERYAGKNIVAFALHPGMVKTNFGSGLTGIYKWGWKLASPFQISPRQGAVTSVFLALDPSVTAHSGAYFKKSKIHASSKDSNSTELRNRLWEISEDLIKPWCSNKTD